METDACEPIGIGQLLRGHRLAARLTQEELAERAGISVRGLRDLERGSRSRPRKDTLLLLADALALTGADRETLLLTMRRAKGPPSRRGPGIAVPSDLQSLSTALIGREEDCRRLKGFLFARDARLITLCGPGGVGKTRVALDVAERVSGAFADGVVVVSLAPISDARLVLPAIARALGLRDSGSRSIAEQLPAYLRARQLLLLLDNFEHVGSAAVEVVALMGACPRVTVLVTSRAALNVRGERRMPLAPLEVPDPSKTYTMERLAEVPAVRLFLVLASGAIWARLDLSGICSERPMRRRVGCISAARPYAARGLVKRGR